MIDDMQRRGFFGLHEPTGHGKLLVHRSTKMEAHPVRAHDARDAGIYFGLAHSDIGMRHSLIRDQRHLETTPSACHRRLDNRQINTQEFNQTIIGPHGGCLSLLRTEEPVPGITKAGDDIGVFVEPFIEGRRVDMYARMCILYHLHALRCGDERHEADVLI